MGFAGSITVAFVCLGASVLLGRYALRQRAIDRAKEGKEIGSLDELFTREYKGEPPRSIWDYFDDRPEGWYWWMFFSIILGLVGITMTIQGLATLL